MKFVKRKLSELRVYENNPRSNQKAIRGVKQSIIKYGYKVPIVIDRDNIIVAGHTRFAALLEIQEERGFPNEIYCIVADDLTEEQLNEFRIVDNLTAENAEWDITKLKSELELLPNLDLSVFGEIPQLTVEEIQIQEENKMDLDGSIVFRAGPDKFEITELEYHDWVQYVIQTYNMTILEFMKKQLHIKPIDREYKKLEI